MIDKMVFAALAQQLVLLCNRIAQWEDGNHEGVYYGAHQVQLTQRLTRDQGEIEYVVRVPHHSSYGDGFDVVWGHGETVEEAFHAAFEKAGIFLVRSMDGAVARHGEVATN